MTAPLDYEYAVEYGYDPAHAGNLIRQTFPTQAEAEAFAAVDRIAAREPRVVRRLVGRWDPIPVQADLFGGAA